MNHLIDTDTTRAILVAKNMASLEEILSTTAPCLEIIEVRLLGIGNWDTELYQRWFISVQAYINLRIEVFMNNHMKQSTGFFC